MSMSYNDIDFTVNNQQFTLHHIEQYNKGYYCGYITAMLYNKETDIDHEILYRITDKQNADNDNKLQSIDYGYNIKNSEKVFNSTEKQLQKLVNGLDIDYEAINQYQREYQC